MGGWASGWVGGWEGGWGGWGNLLLSTSLWRALCLGPVPNWWVQAWGHEGISGPRRVLSTRQLVQAAAPLEADLPARRACRQPPLPRCAALCCVQPRPRERAAGRLPLSCGPLAGSGPPCWGYLPASAVCDRAQHQEQSQQRQRSQHQRQRQLRQRQLLWQQPRGGRSRSGRPGAGSCLGVSACGQGFRPCGGASS